VTLRTLTAMGLVLFCLGCRHSQTSASTAPSKPENAPAVSAAPDSTTPSPSLPGRAEQTPQVSERNEHPFAPDVELAHRLTVAKEQLQKAQISIDEALMLDRQLAKMKKPEALRTSQSDSGSGVLRLRKKKKAASPPPSSSLDELRALSATVAAHRQEAAMLISQASAASSAASASGAPEVNAALVARVEQLSQESSADALKAAQAASELRMAAVGEARTAAKADLIGRSPASIPEQPAAASTLGEQERKWFDQLENAPLQYKVPSTMYWKEASTVTVVIQGPKAPVGSALNGATGSGIVKVSDRMKVVISCPDNPDEFTFVREQGTEEIQFVPLDASTTWKWSVTPKYTGRSQKLSIAAWVLYPGHDDKVLRQLPVYWATIDVDVPGLGESLKRLFEGDPDYWLRYGLPGGVGFVFAAGIAGAFLKRNSNRKKKQRKAHAAKGI
jgi:hypothetical protein